MESELNKEIITMNQKTITITLTEEERTVLLKALNELCDKTDNPVEEETADNIIQKAEA